MPEFFSQAAVDAGEGCDPFTKGYIEAAYFTDTGPDDEADPETGLDPESLRKAIEECKAFQSENASALKRAYSTGYTETQAGHDFWFTRNGHGVGFWDRDLGDVGDKLSDAAHAYGERNVGLSDDGKLVIE